MFALTPVFLAVQALSQPLRFASNANYASSSFNTTSGTRLNQISRIAFWIGSGDMSELVLSFHNWILATTAITLGPNAFSVVKCAIEKDSGTTVPVTFSGGRTKTINAGDTDVQSDPIRPSSWGLSKFDRNSKWWLRLEISVTTAGHQHPKGIAYTGSRGGTFPAWVGWAFDPAEGSRPSDVDSTGNISLTGSGGAGVNNPYTPQILGRFVSGDPPTWLGLGDSIMDFSNDNLSGYGYAGFFARAMVNDTFNGNFVGGMNFGSSGSKANMWTTGNAPKATTYWKYAKYAIEEFGTNNFAGSDTLATVQSQVSTLWALAYAQGIQGILRTKLLPRTSATSDSYVTEAGQTKLTEFQVGGKAAQFNTWLDTQVGTGLCTSLLDVTAIRGTDTWAWAVNGTANYATTDGIHPSPAGHALMATAVRTAMASYS
jgi:lysophospholipase L1-like esterase